MNGKHRKTIGSGMAILLVTVTICFIPAIASAFPSGEEMRGGPGDKKGHRRPVLGIWRNPQLVQELGLTDEQVKQVRDTDFAFREKHLALRARLDDMVLGGDPDAAEDAIPVLLARGVRPRGDEIARMVSAAGSRGDRLSRRGTVLLLRWAATGDCRISRPFLEKLLRHESREVRTAAARAVVRLATREISDTH